MRFLPRAETVLPLTIVCAAVILGISEFMVTFEFTPPGGEALGQSLASDRHSYALLLLAIFAVASMLAAIATGLRSFAVGTAILGVAALLIFLIVDLPDAGKLGTLGGDSEFTFSTAKAEPQSGFVAEAFGAVILGLASVAFATLRSTQLQAPLARLGARGEDGSDERVLAGAPDGAAPGSARAVAARRAEEREARRRSAPRGPDTAPFDFDGERPAKQGESASASSSNGSSTTSAATGGLLRRLRGSGR